MKIYEENPAPTHRPMHTDEELNAMPDDSPTDPAKRAEWLRALNERATLGQVMFERWQPGPLLNEVLGDIPKIKKYEVFLAVRRFTPQPGDSKDRIEAKIEWGIDEIRPFASGVSQEKLLTLWSVPVDQLGKE